MAIVYADGEINMAESFMGGEGKVLEQLSEVTGLDNENVRGLGMEGLSRVLTERGIPIEKAVPSFRLEELDKPIIIGEMCRRKLGAVHRTPKEGQKLTGFDSCPTEAEIRHYVRFRALDQLYRISLSPN